MNVSRRGIVLDIENSPYVSTIKYGETTLMFYFSSSLYMSKFEIEMKINREKINKSLSKRFKLDIKCDLLCDINLYSKIEKRGFYILANDMELTCLDNIKLSGNQVIMKN